MLASTMPSAAMEATACAMEATDFAAMEAAGECGRREPPEESQIQPRIKKEVGTVVENTGHIEPIGICDKRCAVYEPRIVSRHVDDVRICRLDVDRLVLRRHGLLAVRLERSCRLRAL